MNRSSVFFTTSELSWIFDECKIDNPFSFQCICASWCKRHFEAGYFNWINGKTNKSNVFSCGFVAEEMIFTLNLQQCLESSSVGINCTNCVQIYFGWELLLNLGICRIKTECFGVNCATNSKSHLFEKWNLKSFFLWYLCWWHEKLQRSNLLIE